MNEQRIPVLDRVRKLLSLAGNSANAHEAALAAARAAALMERHEIHEAELRALDEAATIVTAEPIDELAATAPRRKRVAWHHTLARAVGLKLHCHHYTSRDVGGSSIVFFGRLSAIQGASYLLAFLIAEVERLAKQAELVGKAEHNAFKLGCARRIGERLNPERKAPKSWRDVRTADAPVATDDDVAPSDGAIVIVKRDREEVDAAWQARIKGFHTTRGIGRTSNTSAFVRGRKAGDSASLGGDAKAALKPGQGVLK